MSESNKNIACYDNIKQLLTVNIVRHSVEWSEGKNVLVIKGFIKVVVELQKQYPQLTEKEVSDSLIKHIKIVEMKLSNYIFGIDRCAIELTDLVESKRVIK